MGGDVLRPSRCGARPETSDASRSCHVQHQSEASHGLDQPLVSNTHNHLPIRERVNTGLRHQKARHNQYRRQRRPETQGAAWRTGTAQINQEGTAPRKYPRSRAGWGSGVGRMSRAEARASRGIVVGGGGVEFLPVAVSCVCCFRAIVSNFS